MKQILTSMLVTLLVVQPGSAFSETGAAGSPLTAASTESAPAATQTKKAAASEKPPEAINGAFGITLGVPFEASVVEQVISEQTQNYRGADGKEFAGMLFRIEPRQTDERFQRYAVKTTVDGIVYEIQADYQFELDKTMSEQGKPKRSRKLRKTCKNVVKSLAKEHEARYGKARGQGWDGEWYAFRQASDDSDRSIRLLANRCRTGFYSAIYTDNAVLKTDRDAKANNNQ